MEKRYSVMKPESDSSFGFALALPQIARSSDYEGLFTIIAVRALGHLVLTVGIQIALILFIGEANKVMSTLGGQMNLCDFGAQLDQCPGGPQCTGPGGTEYTKVRVYSFMQWNIQTFVKNAMLNVLPDKEDGKIFQAVPFKKGDRYDVGMLYQQDSKPHYGVMGFPVLFVHRANKTKVNSPRTVNFQDLWREMQEQVGVKDMECRLCALLTKSQSLQTATMSVETECNSLSDSRLRTACLGVASLAANAIAAEGQTFQDLDSACSMFCADKHPSKSMPFLV